MNSMVLDGDTQVMLFSEQKTIQGLTQKFPDNVLFAVCSNAVAWTTSGMRCYMLLVYLCKISGVYVKYSILYPRVNEVCKVSCAAFQKNGNKRNY